MTSNTEIKNMSFENALKELESIVSKLENGQMELEKAIESYTRGSELKKHCEKKLSEAKLKIEKITKSDSNELKAEPFNIAD